MADKPNKVEAKINDLRGQNEVLLRKLLSKLGASGLVNAGYKEAEKQDKADPKAGRSIFQEVQRSVVSGYSKPGSSSVMGPHDFFKKYMGGDEEGADGKDGGIPKKMPPWWKKLVGPALLILGGLAAFVTGIMTDGPLKGFMKLLSQGGIMGGLKWMARILNNVVLKSIKTLTKVFGADAVKAVLGSGKQLVTKIILPFKRFFISTIPKFIGNLIGPLAKVVGSSAGGVTKMLAKVGVFLVKNLKFIPLLGGLISFGFAISRYRKGDVIGGTIDLVSGILGMVPPGPWSAVTIPLSIGLSVLNAFLDMKSGGATGKQQGKKGNLLKKWGAKLLGFIFRIPPISTVYHLVQGITQGVSGNWKAAANHFMYSIPFIGAALDWFNIGGFKTEKGEPVKGSPSSFWGNILGFITKIPPLQQVFSIGKMIGAIFQGNWAKAAKFAMYSLPGVGMLLDWFNIGSGMGVPEGEKVEGTKDSFAAKLFGFIAKLPPFSIVTSLVKGLKLVFAGKIFEGLAEMRYGMPMAGTVIGFLGGPATKEEALEQLGDKKGFKAKLMHFLTGFPPFSYIRDFARGIKSVFKGDIFKGMMQMQYAVPFIGSIRKWMGGPATAEEAIESVGDKKGFFGKMVGFVGQMFPFSNIKKFYQGIKSVFKGDILKGMMQMQYAVPFVGTLRKWFGLPGTPDEAVEFLGDKASWINKIWGFVLKLSPFTNVMNLWKGVSSVFKGDFKTAGKHFMHSIPVIGNLLEWFGVGKVEPEGEKVTGSKQGFWSGIWKWVTQLPPLSMIMNIGRGIKSVLSGQWGKAATFFAFSLPFVSTLFNFFGGPKPVTEIAEEVGSKKGFWGAIKTLFVNLPPISWLLNMGKGIKAVLKGQWSAAGFYFATGIPLVGKVFRWFGGPTTPPETAEDVGTKKGFWSSIFGFITKLPPISNVIHLAKGISNIFKGNFTTAGKHMMRSIPIIGNLIGWFGGDVGAPEDNEPLGANKGFFGAIKGAFLEKFKAVWNKLPKWAKWTAKKIPFIGSLLKQLDAQEDKDFDAAADAEVGGAISAGYESVKRTGSVIWTSIGDRLKGIGDQAKKSWEGITSIAKKAWGSVKEGYNDLANAYEKEGVKGVMKESAKKLMSAGKEIVGGAKKLASRAWSWLKGSPYAWEILQDASDKVVDGTKKMAKEAPTHAQKMWGGISDAFSAIKKGATKDVDKLKNVAGTALQGARKGLGALWGGAKKLGNKMIGGDSADPMKTLSVNARNTYLRLRKIHSTIYDIQKGLDNKVKSPDQTRNIYLRLKKVHSTAYRQLQVSTRTSADIKQILGLLETAVFPGAENRGRLIGASTAAKMQREMAVESDTTNLQKSVSLQKDMLTELKEGNIYTAITDLNTHLGEKLDSISENIGGTGQNIGILGNQGGTGSAPAQSPGRFDRMGNRPIIP